MANKTVFGNVTQQTNAVNEADGAAFRFGPKHALAQLAATGCFNNTYYVSAENQLDTLMSLAAQVPENDFLAKLAIYSRQKAFLKDMPAALLLILSRRDPKLFQTAFDCVVDNGRVLRTMFQMLRSGRFGRKSLAHGMQRAFQRWLNTASVPALLSAAIGSDPSLRDVMRLARPTPPDNARRALFGWLADRPADKWTPATAADLPREVVDLTAYRAAQTESEQVAILERNRFRWDLLADAARGPLTWKGIARQMGPQALRMNLNTLHRHEVLNDPEMVNYVADRLRDPEEIRRSRQFPYQFFAAYRNADTAIPQSIRAALNDAAEIACGNVPVLAGPIVIGVDVSGSMSSPVTGYQTAGSTTKMRCVDVAGLFAAAVMRCNPGSVVVPFDTRAFDAPVAADERILDVANRLAAYGGGGTDCSLPLSHANARLTERRFAGCVLVSDNESWVRPGQHGSTAVLDEWTAFARNQARLAQADGMKANPKLVCIDLQPNTTTQAPDRADILNVGGFSDAVFEVVAGFLADDGHRFVEEVEAIALAS